MTKPRKPRAPRPPKIAETPAVPGIVWCSTVKTQKRQWLIRDKIPAHVASMVEGRKASGKSTLLTAIVAAFTGGPAIPGWEGPKDGRVLWLAGEEDWGTEIKPRLISAAANIDRVGYVALPNGSEETRSPRLPSDLRRLFEMMTLAGAGMLVIDPLPSLMDNADDLKSERGVRSVIDPCNKIAAERGWHFIFSRHIRPDQRVDVRHAGYGHASLTNAPRCVSRVDVDPEDISRRLWSTVALNATPSSRTYAFHLRNGAAGSAHIEWAGYSSLTAQQIAESHTDELTLDETIDATTILVANLATEWVKFTELVRIGMGFGVSQFALRRAAKKLGVRKDCDRPGPGSIMEWGPPEGGFPAHLLEMVSAMGSGRGSAQHYPNDQIAGKIGKRNDDQPGPGVMPSAQGITPPPAPGEVKNAAE